MGKTPDQPFRMAPMQKFHCRSQPIPPGKKATVKGGTFLYAEERTARRRFWFTTVAIAAALVAGILIGRFLLG